MNNSLQNYFFNRLSYNLRKFMPVSASIRGDFHIHMDSMDHIYVNVLLEKRAVVKLKLHKGLSIHLKNNNDIYLKGYDDSRFCNKVSMYITENRNRIEFNASNVSEKGKKPNYIEESDYVYDPKTGKYYIYNSRVSYIHNEVFMMIQTFDAKGNEEKRNVYHGNLDKAIVKTKSL